MSGTCRGHVRRNSRWEPASKQIQTPRYIVQNSMNLKQYRHRPSHDSSQCFNLFPASAEKLERHIVLEKGFSEKISTRKQYTIHSNNFIPFKMFHFKSHPYWKISFRKFKRLQNFPQSKERTSTLSKLPRKSRENCRTDLQQAVK